MIQILCDTREQNPLIFSACEGVEIITTTLQVGDYQARIKDGEMFKTVWERKSLQDLYGSFSGGYENEKKKIGKAKSLGLKYILGIEATVFEVREGNHYQKDGETRWSKKNGISQIRQLMTMYVKEYFDVWFFSSRQEMSFTIQEYFLAQERVNAATSAAVKH